MTIQPNLLALNTQPLSLATKGQAPEPAPVPEQIAPTPAKPIVDGFFISPLLQFDNQALAMIFQVRDSVSGEVQRQFPRESVVENLRSNPEVRAITIPEKNDVAIEVAQPEPVLVGAGNDAAETAPALGAAVAGAVEVSAGAEVSNGAPAVGGTSTGVAPELGPSDQGVDVLV